MASNTEFNPRASVLRMFDPLMASETPPRDSSSPDLAASDKENDAPAPGSVTIFFNRIYTHPKLTKAKTPPKGKLIDFGDESFEDMADISSIHGESSSGERRESLEDEDRDENENENIENGEESFSSSSSTPSRRPLADIKLAKSPVPGRPMPPTIEEDPTESSSNSPSHAFNPLIDDDSLDYSSNKVGAAPLGTPLADVINSINLSSMSLSELSEPMMEEVEEVGAITCPDINVCPPEAVSVPSSPAPTFSAIHLSPEAFVPSPPIPRTRSTTTSSVDPRRISVDLYSTFSAQMQSPDMSFDLINDRISFNGQDQDSFWSSVTDDDTLDFSKNDKDKPTDKNRRKSVDKPSNSSPLYSTPQADKSQRLPVFSLPPTPALPSLTKIDDASPEPTVVIPPAGPSLVEEPLPEPDVEEIQSLPVVPRTPIAPALRVFKKTFNLHDRSVSVSSVNSASTIATSSSSTRGRAGSVTSSGSGSRCASRTDSELSAGEERRTSKETERKPTVNKGVSKPSTGLPQTPAARLSKVIAKPTTTILSRNRSASISTSAPKAQRSSVVPSTRVTRSTAATSNVQQPMVKPLSGNIGRPSISTAPSGIRAPTASASGLPRPASKLPAPSRIAGLRSFASGSSKRV